MCRVPPEVKNDLRRRIERQRAFFARREPGDLLISVACVAPDSFKELATLQLRAYEAARQFSLETFLQQNLPPDDPEAVLRDEKALEALVETWVRAMRARRDSQPIAFVDDTVPGEGAYLGIGAITAAMTGKRPVLSDENKTTWLEANLSWEEIANLRFDPQNPWIMYAVTLDRTLWRLWDEDYLVAPYFFRSPLDAANGIRGNTLFADLYLYPQEAKALLDWCADWAIQMVNYLEAQVHRPGGWPTGGWGCALPDRAVTVNGDPTGLISRAMHLEFDRPYTAKLFTSVGGGFFHHHAIGRHQVDLVAETRGMVVQEIIDDPTCAGTAEAMIHDGAMREKILQASLKVPIQIDYVPYGLLDALLPIVEEGRFILTVICESEDEAREAICTVRRVSTLG